MIVILTGLRVTFLVLYPGKHLETLVGAHRAQESRPAPQEGLKKTMVEYRINNDCNAQINY